MRVHALTVVVCALTALGGQVPHGPAASAGRQEDRAADRAAIEKLRQQDIAATLSRDPVALTDYWTDDAIRLGAGAPAEVGKETIRTSNERQTANQNFKVLTVAQRRREIGIRSALGAQPGHLVTAVFKRAFWQIGAGSAAGMLAAYLVGRYVPIEQVGGLPIPGILPGAAALMLLVGVLASLGPARRGLRIDPSEALRSE